METLREGQQRRCELAPDGEIDAPEAVLHGTAQQQLQCGDGGLERRAVAGGAGEGDGNDGEEVGGDGGEEGEVEQEEAAEVLKQRLQEQRGEWEAGAGD